MATIRHERYEDARGVRAVNEAAFGQSTEADLVDMLRIHVPDAVSLVAEDGGSIVGHILFTPAVIEGPGGCVEGVGLAPVAVAPGHQNRGVGSDLVTQGIAILRERGIPFVIVLGHPEYYPRFGFERASSRGLASQWSDVPDEAFMVLVLDEKVMEGVTGVASFRDEFGEAR